MRVKPKGSSTAVNLQLARPKRVTIICIEIIVYSLSKSTVEELKITSATWTTSSTRTKSW